METKKEITLRDYRQTCRLKVTIFGTKHIVLLKFAHQRSDGQNDIPIGDMVYLEPFNHWFNTDDVDVLQVLPWNDLENIIGVVYRAHNIRANSIQVKLDFGLKTHNFLGQTVQIIEMGIPILELLTAESTPQNHILDPNAGAKFESHTEALALRCQRFYTTLSSKWALPAIYWSEVQ